MIKVAEISFDEGLDLVASCYAKHAFDASSLMTTLQGIPGQVSKAYSGLGDDAKATLMNTGMGVAGGAGLGLASAFTQPKDRRNYLSRMLTGAMTGGAMGAAYRPAVSLFKNIDPNLDAEGLAKAQAANTEAATTMPRGGRPTGTTVKVDVGPNPTDPTKSSTADAPVTLPPTAASAEAETFNPQRWDSPSEAWQSTKDVMLGKQWGNETDSWLETGGDIAAAVSPHSAGLLAGVSTNNAVKNLQARRAGMANGGMSGGAVIRDVLTNAGSSHGLTPGAEESLKKVVGLLQNSGMDAEDIAKLVQTHGTDPKAILMAMKPQDMLANVAVQRQLAQLQQQINSTTDSATKAYLISLTKPLMQQQAEHQAYGALDQAVNAAVPPPRVGTGTPNTPLKPPKASATPVHMTPKDVSNMAARARTSKFVPSRLQNIGRIGLSTGVGLATDYAGRAGLNALLPDAQRENLRRWEEDVAAQGIPQQ